MSTSLLSHNFAPLLENKLAFEQALRPHGPTRDIVHQPYGLQVNGPPAFLDPEATRPLAASTHLNHQGPGTSGTAPTEGAKHQAPGPDFDISRLAPVLKGQKRCAAAREGVRYSSSRAAPQQRCVCLGGCIGVMADALHGCHPVVHDTHTAAWLVPCTIWWVHVAPLGGVCRGDDERGAPPGAVVEGKAKKYKTDDGPEATQQYSAVQMWVT